MKQNIYDDPTFFDGYKAFREDPGAINRFLEQPALHSLTGSCAGLSVLDLGCGMGDFCRHARNTGAERVVGVDLSKRMLGEATKDGRGIEYRRGAVESCRFAAESFDLVVSSYMFHYVKDFSFAMKRVARWMKPGARLVFSVEHPVQTCASLYWEHDSEGRRIAFRMRDYQNEGVRKGHWFVDGVVKYHRTTETYVREVLGSGLVLEALREPRVASRFERQRPELRSQRERPAVLLLAAQKPL